MNAIDKLAGLFARFPGIGPRQAHRFVHFLLRSSPSIRAEIADAIHGLSTSVRQCPSCQRFHGGSSAECTICRNAQRDNALLMLVANDSDVHSVERSNTYHGYYFVLGNTLSLSADKPTDLRELQLQSVVKKRTENGLKEIVLALPANPEGDATAKHIREKLKTLSEGHGLRISMLGRGLSTGSELEYADPETIKNALANRG